MESSAITNNKKKTRGLRAITNKKKIWGPRATTTTNKKKKKISTRKKKKLGSCVTSNKKKKFWGPRATTNKKSKCPLKFPRNGGEAIRGEAMPGRDPRAGNNQAF